MLLLGCLVVAVVFAAIHACFALPLPQDPAMPFVEVDITQLTTTLADLGAAVAPTPVLQPVAAAVFTPLFVPAVLDSGDDSSSSSNSPSPVSAPLVTVTQMITAYVTPDPTTVVQLVTAVDIPAEPSPVVIDPAPIATPTDAPAPTTDAPVPPPPAPTDATPTPPPAQAPMPTYPPPTWSLPAQFSDLSAFSVQKYAGGQSNIAIVTGIPATASATAAPAQVTAAPVTPWDNDTDNAMQLLFPKGSINPGNKPQGGADFYATPIDLSAATNVTMEYSVFMDASMEWVKGGKLPGLYGGHEGCSGGDVADTCFSTRLMWRPEGVGELYLYAEKARQLPSLCSAPDSECNEVYGLSLGRGSFSYAPGGWTNLRQTVRLNTPGVPDGGFTLDVNGTRVMSLDGIFYRNVKQADNASSAPKPSATPTPIATAAPAPASPTPPPVPTTSADIPPLLPTTDLPPLLGGLLGGLGGLLGGETARSADSAAPTPAPGLGLFGRVGEAPAPVQRRSLPLGTVELIAPRHLQVTRDRKEPASSSGRERRQLISGDVTLAPATDSGASSLPSDPSTPLVNTNAVGEGPEPAFGFTGIFFSTFFGGHDPSWASPKDQYMWFKDFALTINE